MIPEFANESGFNGLLAAFAVVAAMLIAASIAALVFSILMRYSQRDDRDALDTRMLKASRGPVVLSLVIFGVFLGYLLLTNLTHPSFDFFDGHQDYAVRAWLISVVLQASHLGSQLLKALVRWYLARLPEGTPSQVNDRLLGQAKWLTPVVAYSIGALIVLDLLGVAVTPLVAGLGIGGIAVALALQPTLSNVFSGAFMLTEGELNRDDFIELQGGPSGFVVEVSWRSTKIRDRFNNLIMIPNSMMMQSVMTNYYSESKVMAVRVQCGISYQEDLERVEEVALEVATQVRDDVEVAVDDFDPVFRFTSFGESNVDFVVVMRALDRNATFEVSHELIKRLQARFEREGIVINYPVRKLLVPNSNGVPDASPAPLA